MVIRNEKILAATALGFFSAVAIHFDYVRQHALGRDAFLAVQSARFDKYIASPHWSLLSIIVTIFMVGLYVGLYEGFVVLLSKVASTSTEK